jgi:hypothetical protein
MSGRKCECCVSKDLGYCPFGSACKQEVWERFNKVSFNTNRQGFHIIVSRGCVLRGGSKHEKSIR